MVDLHNCKSYTQLLVFTVLSKLDYQLFITVINHTIIKQCMITRIQQHDNLMLVIQFCVTVCNSCPADITVQRTFIFAGLL